MLEVLPLERASMRLRDGIRLDADIYRPNTPGEFPVLLMRQPYGRKIASTVCYAHPAWYAAHGYIVAIQDVRGCGTSEGAFRVFEGEAQDGHDAVEWAAGLPGSTGAVGMYGFSYQGVTQLLAAAMRPPALKAIAPAMTGWDFRHDWAYENAAFPLAANVAWAVQLAAISARRVGDMAAFAELAEAAGQHRLGNIRPAYPEVLSRYAHHAPHYARWLETDFEDPYWRRISPDAAASSLTNGGPPALFVSGWYDTHLPGTIAAYRAYEAAGNRDARLHIGPWPHFPWGSRLSGVDFGDSAIGEVDQLHIRWFDQHLKGIVSPVAQAQSVRLFDVGSGDWRGFADWPGHATPWHLASTGRAGLDERDGSLSEEKPAGSEAIDHLVHDPWRPVGTVGGAYGMPCGPVDRTEADSRPDVLTYTTAGLHAPLSLAGSPEVSLAVQADRPSFDLSCTLSRVDTLGHVHHLTEAYAHFPSPDARPRQFALRPLCVTIPAGERLRLSIAAASFPAYPVNPGTGQRPVDAAMGEAEIITLQLMPGQSHVMLPVISVGSGS